MADQDQHPGAQIRPALATGQSASSPVRPIGSRTLCSTLTQSNVQGSSTTVPESQIIKQQKAGPLIVCWGAIWCDPRARRLLLSISARAYDPSIHTTYTRRDRAGPTQQRWRNKANPRATTRWTTETADRRITPSSRKTMGNGSNNNKVATAAWARRPRTVRT